MYSSSRGLKPPRLLKASLFLNSTTLANREPFNSSSSAFDLSSDRIFCHLLASPANQFLRIIASFSCSSHCFSSSQEESKISWAISTVAECFNCLLSLTRNSSGVEKSPLLISKFSSMNFLKSFSTDSPTNSSR